MWFTRRFSVLSASPFTAFMSPHLAFFLFFFSHGTHILGFWRPSIAFNFFIQLRFYCRVFFSFCAYYYYFFVMHCERFVSKCLGFAFLFKDVKDVIYKLIYLHKINSTVSLHDKSLKSDKKQLLNKWIVTHSLKSLLYINIYFLAACCKGSSNNSSG